MHITKGAIATVMGQGLENKCEVVGQGSFTRVQDDVELNVLGCRLT